MEQFFNLLQVYIENFHLQLSGVSNSLDNLSNLVTIPNNILQGDFKEAGVNTGRLVVNTTLGILGLLDVAQHLKKGI